MFVKQKNKRLQQLLAVENKTILQPVVGLGLGGPEARLKRGAL